MCFLFSRVAPVLRITPPDFNQAPGESRDRGKDRGELKRLIFSLYIGSHRSQPRSPLGNTLQSLSLMSPMASVTRSESVLCMYVCTY